MHTNLSLITQVTQVSLKFHKRNDCGVKIKCKQSNHLIPRIATQETEWREASDSLCDDSEDRGDDDDDDDNDDDDDTL